MTLVDKLIANNSKRPSKLAVQYFKNKNLHSMNWEQTFDKVQKISQILTDQQVSRGDLVAIYANTCKEWGFIDLATMAVGAVTVPTYHSSPVAEVECILEEVAPSIIFIENQDLYNKIKDTEIYSQIKTKIVIEDFETNDSDLLFLSQLMGTAQITISIADLAKKIQMADLATIIYTSGTSGQPKGVMLSHEQIISSCSDVFPILGVTDQDKTLTFLPFSHVLGRMELWGHYFCGYTIAYAESIDRLKKNLLDVQPTVLVGVPRIFEKIYFGIKAQVEISKLKQMIFNTAIEIGQKTDSIRRQRKSPSLFQALKTRVADQVVFSSIKGKLGGRLRFAISGGAPLEPTIASLFSACGLTILEGYGLTETTAPIYINTLFENKLGSVGKAIGEVQTRFADDGEVLIKSKKVMLGYYKNEKATAEVFDQDGFFKTGDIGELDEQGYLKLTDRKKDLIKTAGGKFIAPQKLQQLFATQSIIDHVHIHGDKKKYVVALLTLDKDEVFRIKEEQQIEHNSFADLSQCQSVQTEVRRAVAAVNSGLGSFETIKRYHVLDHEFSIEDGHLTPSLKMKRKKIDGMYADQIDQLYN